MSSNASIGANFENAFCKMLKNHGFWALRIIPNAGGQQPADIIAVKGRYTALIDCKVISTKRGFPFYRVEDNQLTAMEQFLKITKEPGWFAIRLDDGEIRMLGEDEIAWALLGGENSFSQEELRSDKTMSLTDWLERAETKCT